MQDKETKVESAKACVPAFQQPDVIPLVSAQGMPWGSEQHICDDVEPLADGFAVIERARLKLMLDLTRQVTSEMDLKVFLGAAVGSIRPPYVL